MKIVCSSDWHLDAVTAGFDRFNDVVRSVEQTVADAIDWKADLYLFLGDLCDPDPNRNARCVAYAIDVAKRLMDKGIASRWLVGNHDVINDGSGTSVLEPLSSATPWPATDSRPMFAVYSRPSFENIGGLVIGALPYVPKAADYDPAAFIRKASTDENVVLIIGHLTVPGLQAGGETTEMPRGRDMVLPMDAIRERFPNALVLNGHYHEHRMFDGTLPCVPGSLERVTFAEQDEAKGWLRIVTGSDRPKEHRHQPWKVTRMGNLTARSLITLDEMDAVWTEPASKAPLKVEGAIVRLRPPADTPDDLVGSVLDAAKAGRAAAVKLLPAPSSRVAIAREETPTAARRTHRQVVTDLAIAGGETLAKFCEQVMDEEGI